MKKSESGKERRKRCQTTSAHKSKGKKGSNSRGGGVVVGWKSRGWKVDGKGAPSRESRTPLGVIERAFDLVRGECGRRVEKWRKRRGKWVERGAFPPPRGAAKGGAWQATWGDGSFVSKTTSFRSLLFKHEKKNKNTKNHLQN